VILKYQTGEEIQKGDRVLFHLKPAEVQFVAIDPSDPDVREFGAGVMIRTPNDPNPTYISADHLDNYEDLEFVARAATP
jgi:hypothetical protein